MNFENIRFVLLSGPRENFNEGSDAKNYFNKYRVKLYQWSRMVRPAAARLFNGRILGAAVDLSAV